jgi:hypothetical protein
MGDGQVLEGMEVADVDSHFLDSLPKGELVASTALRDGMRDIIEPSGVGKWPAIMRYKTTTLGDLSAAVGTILF